MSEAGALYAMMFDVIDELEYSAEYGGNFHCPKCFVRQGELHKPTCKIGKILRRTSEAEEGK